MRGVVCRARRLATSAAVAALAVGVVASATAAAGSAGAAQRASTASFLLAWSSPQSIDKHTLIAIRCPTASFCVAIDNAGNVLTTNAPLAGASAWRRSHVARG